MRSMLGSHLRRHVVAYLALFVALGGTAVAAKPMVTGADIQDGSLTGADVENDSLTGADILESSLARVPSALEASDSVHAEEATNASKLGGVAANGYMRGEGMVAGHFEVLHPGSQSRHYGPTDWFTVSDICSSASDATLFVINRADQKINVFEDDGGTDPIYGSRGRPDRPRGEPSRRPRRDRLRLDASSPQQRLLVPAPDHGGEERGRQYVTSKTAPREPPWSML